MFVNWIHICDANSLGQDLGSFWKPASQFIKYEHNFPIADFGIMLIPEAVFHARAVKFGSVGGLDTFVKISSGFCDNKKIYFWL